jgi:hypothetical protein
MATVKRVDAINTWKELKEQYKNLFSPLLSEEELEIVIKPISSCYLIITDILQSIFRPQITSTDNILFLTNKRIGIGTPIYKSLKKAKWWGIAEVIVGKTLVGYSLGHILTEYSNIEKIKVLDEGDAKLIFYTLNLYTSSLFGEPIIEIPEGYKDKLILIIFKKAPTIHGYGDRTRILFIPPEAQSYTEKEIKTITAKEIRDITNRMYQQSVEEERKHEIVTYNVDVSAILREFKITEKGLLIGNCPYCSAENPLEKGKTLYTCKYCGKQYVVPNKILDLL